MASWPLQQTGSTGEDVKTVQYLLDAHGASLTVDGGFGPLTDAAVQAFQTSHGLTADGIVGNLTWPELIVAVQSGSTGDAVKAVQSQMDSRVGVVTVDGDLGPDTESVVRAFQGDIGLSVDGIVGPLTWNAMVNGFLASTAAVAAAEAVFAAWSNDHAATAARNATPSAVKSLFAHTFSAADGWTFSGSSGAAGHVGVEWTGAPGTLVLLVNDNAGTPFFFVDSIIFP
jgi:murein L,D-transpeptidase YcbB/YkuD